MSKNVDNSPKPNIPAAEAAVDEEMLNVQKNIDIQSRSLQHLKTIRTGKTKILEILRQSGDTLDKKMLEALHERFNDFVRQEAEILAILKTVTGFDSGDAAPATLQKPSQHASTAVDAQKTSADVRELCSQIAETNARLAEAEKRNAKLEKEAANKSLKGTTEERDSLQKQIRDIQEENVQKKQAVLKLLSVLRENPNLLKKQKDQEEKVTTAVLEAASSTPGTSTEYDEIVRHLDSIKQRRTRMTAIRERLTQTQMDDTYQSALKRLEALSTIRQTLEETSTSVEEPASASVVDKSAASTTSVQQVKLANDENDELLDEVRREFISTLGNIATSAPSQPLASNKLTPSSASTCTSCDKILPRLTAIENQLTIQGHRLTMLVDQDEDNKSGSLGAESKKSNTMSLNSARGKPDVQNKLEKDYNFTSSGGTSFEISGEGIANSVEKDICLIIESILPWLNKHGAEVITPELATEFRTVAVNQSNRICFPEGLNSDLFITQLATIIDDTTLQFCGNTFQAVHHLLISEISDILFNELEFFKLINNLDHVKDT